MSTLSTHVLDTSTGRPAAGIEVSVEFGGRVVATGLTDHDGRFRSPEPVGTGEHRMVFRVGAYFSSTGRESFYGEIGLQFRTTAGGGNYHVPLLLSPFGYSTYRGS
jgi:5-hydroxyisourate hydrolase